MNADEARALLDAVRAARGRIAGPWRQSGERSWYREDLLEEAVGMDQASSIASIERYSGVVRRVPAPPIDALMCWGAEPYWVAPEGTSPEEARARTDQGLIAAGVVLLDE